MKPASKRSVCTVSKSSYNSLENPIGIETDTGWCSSRGNGCYNSLENPIGIETSTVAIGKAEALLGYNSLENPIGIETLVVRSRDASTIVTTH